MKRSLSHVGGAVETEGNRTEAKALAHALDVRSSAEDEDASRAHVHGFHTYAARMHPLTAARLVRAFAPGAVLDPFCGSGTVLVEAMIAGHQAIGTDLNPLAVRLARSKTRPRRPEELEELVTAARAVAAHADERRAARAGATRRFVQEDVEVFEPHTLMELGSIRAAIARAPEPARADLELVLSSILVKVSRRRGDTSDKTEARRIAAGYPAKLFVKKTAEYARCHAAFARLLPDPPPRCSVDEDDATELARVRPGTASCIVSSPPYAATYDYAAHHALRLRWLGLDARALERGELGARRNYTALDPRAAARAWENELGRFFAAAAGVLSPGAHMALVMADSAVGPRRAPLAIRANEVAAIVAREHGFAPIARASQRRPHFHGPTTPAFARSPRAEHALLFRRGARDKKPW